MKKTLLLILLALTAAMSAQAQVKYKDIKNDYNPRIYMKQATDPYKPGWSAFASLVVPGLGQALSGEVGRGLAFFGGSVALNAVGNVSARRMLDCFSRDSEGNLVKDSNGKLIMTDEKGAKTAFAVMMGAGLSELVVCIWACCDANRVAKVKNMYYQDMYGRRSAIDMGFEPYVCVAPTGTSVQPAAGLSFRVNF